MNKGRYYLGLIAGKLISKCLSLFPSGATAAPGLYAIKIDKDIVRKLAKQLDFSIVVSGTNGKTTTARILASIFKADGQDLIHNRTGSNLERGIASELIKQANFFDKSQKKVGLWETDEAFLPKALKILKPKIVVLTNLFRDQLDRYGEIDSLAKKWKTALKELPKTSLVVLNSDDPTIASLGKNLKSKVVFYGLRDKKMGTKNISHASDATLCPKCLKPLKYSSCFISHLGIYQCIECHHIQPEADFKADKVKSMEGCLEIVAKAQKKTHKLKIKISGLYNSYNVLAAVTTASLLNISFEKIDLGLESFKPAFGRLEKFTINNKNLKILLVKNPAGFNEVLKTILSHFEQKPISFLISLNDLIADGKDVSWIWDVDFEYLKQFKNLKRIIISGRRAEDLALRIKYSGFPLNKTNFKLEKNFNKAIELLLKSNSKNLFILPTYTAMLDIRKILNKKGLIQSTWKD